MYWAEAIKEQIDVLEPIKSSPELIEKIFKLVDLTSLNSTDTEESIALFCDKATSPLGHVAAVCVYPQFVRQVAAEFANTQIKVATVVNFPDGNNALESVL